MKKVTLLCAAAAVAVSAMSPAYAGGAGAPVIEDEVFVDEAAAPASSLGGAGVAAAILGLVLVGAAISSSNGT